MSFNEKLTAYYEHKSKFLHEGRTREDVIEVEVLRPSSCRCGLSSIFGSCDGSCIYVHYRNKGPHKTCPLARKGLKFHPLELSNNRW